MNERTNAQKATLRCASNLVLACSDPEFTHFDKLWALQDRIRIETNMLGTLKDRKASYLTVITAMLVAADVSVEHPIFEDVRNLLLGSN